MEDTREAGGRRPPIVKPLMFRKLKTIFTECLNTMTTNFQQSYSWFVLEDTREAGGRRPPIVKPLTFRKTDTLHRMFEHDDNQFPTKLFVVCQHLCLNILLISRYPTHFSICILSLYSLHSCR